MRDQERNWISQHQRSAFTKTFRNFALACWIRDLQALDLTVKKTHENPSIGIVLCKEMNKAFVDIVVRNYDSPMGVATYKTKQDMPEELQKALPDLDKMKDLFCKSL